MPCVPTERRIEYRRNWRRVIQAVTSSVWPRKEVMQHVQAIYKKVSARVAAAAEAVEAAGFVGVRPTVAADGIGRLGGMDVGQLVHDHFVQQCGTQARISMGMRC
jgi:hypothetical protein